jgi:hypothetical protein
MAHSHYDRNLSTCNRFCILLRLYPSIQQDYVSMGRKQPAVSLQTARPEATGPDNLESTLKVGLKKELAQKTRTQCNTVLQSFRCSC